MSAIFQKTISGYMVTVYPDFSFEVHCFGNDGQPMAKKGKARNLDTAKKKALRVAIDFVHQHADKLEAELRDAIKEVNEQAEERKADKASKKLYTVKTFEVDQPSGQFSFCVFFSGKKVFESEEKFNERSAAKKAGVQWARETIHQKIDDAVKEMLRNECN